MNEQDNPFKYRHEDQIIKDPIFLKLFGTQIIDLIPGDSLIKKAVIFVSTPGGGKSSLFRIFKPSSLSLIRKFHENEDYSELFQKLKERDIVTESSVNLLGAYLSCARNYSDLELLEIDDGMKQKLFFSLICSRSILILLQGILDLHELTRDDLQRIDFKFPTDAETLPNSPFPCDGKQLYDWASKIENAIYNSLNSYDESFDKSIAIASDLELLRALNPQNITLDDKQIVSHTLILMDDVNYLSKNQHNALYKVLETHRMPLPIWLADRQESIDFLPGNDGREFNIIEIEKTFRERGKKFEIFAKNVANKRAKSGILDITDFSICLDDPMTSHKWNQTFAEIVPKIQARIEKKTAFTKRYNEWILDQKRFQGTEKEKTVGWRTLEISIERSSNGGQQQIFDSPLSPEIYHKSSSAIGPAAEFFLCNDESLPYYFGLSRLVSLASYNIEQFVELAGEFFDEVISKYFLKKSTALSPSEQEQIFKKIAKKYWNDIPRRYTNGVNASKLLEKIGNMAKEQTIRPTAPYLPGVTGFAITRQQYFQINNEALQKKKPEYLTLSETLQTCIANNLIHPEYDYKQGQKNGPSHVVFQLNRLLCVYFGLPLGYGGWRSIKPEEMGKWIMEDDTKND